MSQSKKVVLSPEQKFQQRLEVVRIANGQGTQQAVIKTGVPARTVRAWKEQFREDGVQGLRDESRAPKTVANKKDKDGVLASALKELNEKEPGLTRFQVVAKLMSEDSSDTPTTSWLDRTRKRLGLTQCRKKRSSEHKLRYEREKPGYLQVDTKSIAKEGENGQKLYQFTAIDECSRVRFLGSSLTKGASAATKFLKDALTFFEGLGVNVVQVQTDNGTEFTLPHNEITLASYARGDTDDSQFTLACKERGIRHRLIKPRTPEHNGKVERSHKTDEERFYSRYTFWSQPDHDHALKHVWMPEYNEVRPHTGVGGMTPMEFLKKRLAELKEMELKIPDAPSEEKLAA